MWHVTPVIRPIAHATRILRAIEYITTKDPRAMNDSIQVIDLGFLRRMPAQVYLWGAGVCNIEQAKKGKQVRGGEHGELNEEQRKEDESTESDDGGTSHGVERGHGLYEAC